MPHVESVRHSLDADHLLAYATLGFGVVAVVLLGVSHAAAAWTGVMAVLLGGWSQLVSRTRPERFENVIGATAGAVAVAIGLARGGLL
jgi:hypothetical protein